MKAKGIATPIALGKDWTQQMLFEAVLISKPGADKFNGLWNGKTDWAGADVTDAINDYKKLLTYSNKDRDTFDWTDAEKLLPDAGPCRASGSWPPCVGDPTGPA